MDHKQAIENQSIERYWMGELRPSEREEFEEHFFTCPECSHELNLMETFEVNLKAADKQKTVIPIRRVRAPWTIGAIAAALFVGMVGYDRLVEIPGYRAQIHALSAPAVIDPTVLHATERGDGTAHVTVQANGAAYYVRFDVPETTAAGYDCVIQNAGGTAIERLMGIHASAGGELTLRLTVSRTPPGDYELLLFGAGTNTILRRYPFSVQR